MERDKYVARVEREFLHNHHTTEMTKLGSNDHVIVGRDHWEVVKEYFFQHPEVLNELANKVVNGMIRKRIPSRYIPKP